MKSKLLTFFPSFLGVILLCLAFVEYLEHQAESRILPLPDVHKPLKKQMTQPISQKSRQVVFIQDKNNKNIIVKNLRVSSQPNDRVVNFELFNVGSKPISGKLVCYGKDLTNGHKTVRYPVKGHINYFARRFSRKSCNFPGVEPLDEVVIRIIDDHKTSDRRIVKRIKAAKVVY